MIHKCIMFLSNSCTFAVSSWLLLNSYKPPVGSVSCTSSLFLNALMHGAKSLSASMRLIASFFLSSLDTFIICSSSVNIFILLFFLIKIAIQQIHNFTRMLYEAVINIRNSFCAVECCLPFFHDVFILNQIITSEQFKKPFTNFFILLYLPQCNILRVKLSIRIFLMKINNFIIKIIIKFINIL